MQIAGPNEQPIRDELQVMQELLPLSNARVLELGCGAAGMTQALAERTDVGHIVGAEVDKVAHELNMTKAIDRVSFARFGAEEINAGDASFDIVIMLKSLHHVPGEQLPAAFAEIHRVLKPGAFAYISEPVFAGDLNEVIRLFHDEEAVRGAAFSATREAVECGQFELAQEYFYLNPVAMRSFEQFEQGVMRVTHTEHNLTDELVDRVRERFESFKGEDPATPYQFRSPMRVDLLRKVA